MPGKRSDWADPNMRGWTDVKPRPNAIRSLPGPVAVITSALAPARRYGVGEGVQPSGRPPDPHPGGGLTAWGCGWRRYMRESEDECQSCQDQRRDRPLPARNSARFVPAPNVGGSPCSLRVREIGPSALSRGSGPKAFSVSRTEKVFSWRFIRVLFCTVSGRSAGSWSGSAAN